MNIGIYETYMVVEFQTIPVLVPFRHTVLPHFGDPA